MYLCIQPELYFTVETRRPSKIFYVELNYKNQYAGKSESGPEMEHFATEVFTFDEEAGGSATRSIEGKQNLKMHN